MKISKILSVGDYVYSGYDGRPMKVLQMNKDGFETEEDFFYWDEHNILFYLHESTYKGKAKK